MQGIDAVLAGAAASGISVFNASGDTGGRLAVRSAGNDYPKRSHVVIGPASSVSVDGDMELTAKWRAKIAAKTMLNVSGDLNMDAGAGMKCNVASSANVTFGTKSGNCAPKLP